MACIYVLRSVRTGKRYIGSSHEDNPAQRLKEHNYQEYLQDYTEARKREKFLKSGQGRLWLDKNIVNNTI